MSVKPQSQERIKLACAALEEALSNFEKEDSAEYKRKHDQLTQLKRQLETIRTQLDELSR